MSKHLTALPVYNEAHSVNAVLDQVLRHCDQVLVVDDGSDDGTSDILDKRTDVRVVRHDQNLGYGAALVTAFRYAVSEGYETLVTIDCDGQHEPQRIDDLVSELQRTGADIISGSRYLKEFDKNSTAPQQRRQINRQITDELNELLGMELTDAFCGFKAYRVSALRCLEITEPGYAMPLELWVQAAHHKLRVEEMAVPLIYLDEKRSFGGDLDNGAKRLDYYHKIIQQSLDRLTAECRYPCCQSG